MGWLGALRVLFLVSAGAHLTWEVVQLPLPTRTPAVPGWLVCAGGVCVTTIGHASPRRPCRHSRRIRALILARLDDIARTERVRLNLAVESGSRAWGFAPPDSDYDVRFLYVRRVEDYAALELPRDVIERPIDGALDLGGWDLRKGLSLGLRWNPALVEWLSSPIVYLEAGWEAQALRRLFGGGLQGHAALIRHYYGLGFSQFARHIDGRTAVNLKKYFYVVRPAVALLWLETRPGETPPMSLPALLDGVALDGEVAAAIVDLRARKIAAVEAGKGERIGALDAFCLARIAWARAHLPAGGLREDPALRAAAERMFHASVFGLAAPGSI